MATDDLGQRESLLASSSTLLREIVEKYPSSNVAVQLVADDSAAGLTRAKVARALADTRDQIELVRCPEKPTRRCLLRRAIAMIERPTDDLLWPAVPRIAKARLTAALGDRATAKTLLLEAAAIVAKEARGKSTDYVSPRSLAIAATELGEMQLAEHAEQLVPANVRSDIRDERYITLYFKSPAQADQVLPEIARDPQRLDKVLAKASLEIAGRGDFPKAERAARSIRDDAARSEALGTLANMWFLAGHAADAGRLFLEAASLMPESSEKAVRYRTEARIVAKPFPSDEAPNDQLRTALSFLRSKPADGAKVDEAIKVALQTSASQDRPYTLIEIAGALPPSAQARARELVEEALATVPDDELDSLIFLLSDNAPEAIRLHVIQQVLYHPRFEAHELRLEFLSRYLPDRLSG